MKKIWVVFGLIFVCITALAHSVEWYVDDSLYQTTTCNSGDSITPPTAPAKYGYTFTKWREPYTELEYIESTGTQYIDTGYKPNQDTKVEADFELNTSLNLNVVFFGATSFWRNASFGHYIGSAGHVYSNYNSDTGIDSAFQPALNTRYLYTHDKRNIYIDGVLKYTHTAATFQSTGNMFLGRVEGAGSFSFKGKYYSVKIWDNNTLVRNFIPCKDPNDVVGMFDTVTQTFFTNAGTGDFIAGPEVGDL